MSAIHVLKEGHEWGPFTAEELEGQVEAGAFSREDLFWTDGMEDWQPLSLVIQMVDAEAEAVPAEEQVYYDRGGLRVTAEKIELEGADLPLGLVVRAEAQVEIRRRLRAYAGCIILAVIILCVALVEIPRTTFTHWALWGAVLAGLGIWCLRCAYSAFRPSRSHVAIDLVDHDERIVQIRAEEAHAFADAINRALAEHPPKRSGHHHEPPHPHRH